MAKRGSIVRQAVSRAFGVFALCAGTALALWFSGRITAFGAARNAASPIVGLFSDFSGFWPDVAARPFDFGPLQTYALPLIGGQSAPLPGAAVLGTWAVVAVLIASVLGYGAYIRHRAAYTGKEHGQARFATLAEMARVADRAVPENNIWYSRHLRVCIRPRTRAQRKHTQGSNLHALILGPSGKGKTLYHATADVQQSVGGHLKALPATGPVNRLKCIAEHALYAPGMEPTPLGRALGRRRPDCLMPSVPAKGVKDGYDFVCADLKGEITRQFGTLLEAGGAEVCVFDIKGFEGLHYNPFDPRYLPTRLTDCCDAEVVECNFSVSCAGNVVKSPTGAHIGSSHKASITIGSGDATARVEVCLNMDTVATSADDYNDDVARKVVSETLESLDAQALSAREAWKAATPEERQGAQVVNPADVIRNFRYKRTSGDFEIYIHLPEGETDFPEEIEVRVEIDPHLALQPFFGAPGTAEIRETSHGRYVSWKVAPEDWGTLDARSNIIILCAACWIEPMRVADGGMLLRIVNCMVENLGSEGSGDGTNEAFWTGTKIMKLTSHVAYLVEAYDAKYRNIPELIRMIDLAKPEDEKNPKELTPLDYLMRVWETGEEYEEIQSHDRGSEIGQFEAAARYGWVLRQTPHSQDRSLAIRCYKAYKGGAGDTVASINITVDEAITKLCPEEVRDMLRDDELALDTLGMGEGQRCLFIQTDHFDQTFRFLVSLVVFQTFNCIARNADRNGGKVRRHIRFILDEFDNSVGKIPHFTSVMTVGRSLNFSLALYVQSLSQLKGTYGEEDAKTIQDNVGSTVFLGGSKDPEALEKVSKLLGSTTVYATTTSVSRNGGQAFGAASVSEQTQSHEHPLMSVEELTNLPMAECIVLTSALAHGVRDKRNDSLSHPYYAYSYSDHPRKLTQRVARVTEPYDFKASQAKRRRQRHCGKQPASPATESKR